MCAVRLAMTFTPTDNRIKGLIGKWRGPQQKPTQFTVSLSSQQHPSAPEAVTLMNIKYVAAGCCSSSTV